MPSAHLISSAADWAATAKPWRLVTECTRPRHLRATPPHQPNSRPNSNASSQPPRAAGGLQCGEIFNLTKIVPVVFGQIRNSVLLRMSATTELGDGK